jgi:hypothetical protein
MLHRPLETAGRIKPQLIVHLRSDLAMKGQTAPRPLCSRLTAAATVSTPSAASSPEEDTPACTTCLPKKPKNPRLRHRADAVRLPLPQQAMLGENSIALKTGTAEQRLEMAKKLAEQIKRETKEGREAKQDDMYNGYGDR